MPDHRTRRQKLEAMASQTVSPHEAQVARELLAKMGPESTPVRPRPVEARWTTSTNWTQAAEMYRRAEDFVRNWSAFTGGFTSNPAPDDRPGGGYRAWAPGEWVEEPHWFAEWFAAGQRRQGADERDIANALREMRIKNGWTVE